MAARLIGVILKDAVSFKEDESPHPQCLVGRLDRFDPAKDTFFMQGLCALHIGLRACAAIVSVVDNVHLLPLLITHPNDARFTDYAYECIPPSAEDVSLLPFQEVLERDLFTIVATSHHATRAVIAERRHRKVHPQKRELTPQEQRDRDVWNEVMTEMKARIAARAGSRFIGDADSRAWWQRVEERREHERRCDAALIEAQVRLAELQSERVVVQCESEIERELRGALGQQTACVALTDEERASIRFGAVTKIVRPGRSECWSRLVWPGFKTGQFVFGTAPADRAQYLIRYNYDNERLPVDTGGVMELDERTSGRVCLSSSGYSLRVPRLDDYERTWLPSGAVPPPGYPVTTPYENQIRNINTRPTATLSRSQAGARYARTLKERADAKSLLWQKHNAQKAAFAAKRAEEERIREAEERVRNFGT